MRISSCWMTLSASLVILMPTFTVDAQDAGTNPTTYIPASRISQPQQSSNAALGANLSANSNIPKHSERGKLAAANSELNLKEISPSAKRPISLVQPHRGTRLISQVRRVSSLEPATEQSAPPSPPPEAPDKLTSKLPSKLPGKIAPKPPADLPKLTSEIPAKTPAAPTQLTNKTPAKDPLELPNAIASQHAIVSQPLQTIGAKPPAKKPASVTATPPTKPDASSSVKMAPNATQAKLPAKKPAVVTTTPATQPTQPGISSSVKTALDSARAKLSGKNPALETATSSTQSDTQTKASPNVNLKIEPDPNQVKSTSSAPTLATATPNAVPDANPNANPNAKIEPDSNKPQSDESQKTANPPIDPKNSPQNSKVAIGLDPRQPLVVPTTPSQVAIERTQPITLQEALELANRNSPTIAQARLAVERAKALMDEAVAARSPTVDAQVRYDYSNSAQVNASNNARTPSIFNPPTSPISHTLNGTVGVNYNIYNSGQVDASIRAAENTLRASEADFNRIAQTTRLSVATAYYNAQNADGQVRIREQQVQNSERSLQDTEALERAGVGTKFDVLQSQVQLANARQNLSSARADQAISRRELARQLSYPPNLDLVAADEIKPAEDWKPGLEETILLALRNRSELDVQKLQREVARDRAKAALAALGPQVNLVANFDQFENFNQVGGIALGYSVGFNINWRLFDGGAANARANQFEADRALAEVRFTESGNQARFDVESAYNNLKSRREQIESTTLAVKQANEALRLSRLRLSAGVGTQLEVLRSQDDLTQADVNRLNAIVGFNLSLVQLQRAINGL